MQKDLSLTQNDYAIYLPAISGAYAGPIGRQYEDSSYIPAGRIPPGMPDGPTSLDFFRDDRYMFRYPWALFSAGHATLDPTKPARNETMMYERNRDRTFLLGDSGGYQIGKGVWAGDWIDPNCERAGKKRREVLAWMERYMDYGMVLDIPTWISKRPESAAATNIHSFDSAVIATKLNHEYWMKHRSGKCKFLNVLQGETHGQADRWYEEMKDYSDPTIYPNTYFNGWAMGGQNMCDIHLVLRRLITLRFDGLLEDGIHDWMHFLGTSRLEWAVILTAIQRSVRKYHNPNFTVSFDSASPFLSTANGKIYTKYRIEPNTRWSLFIEDMIDDKKYANDPTLLGDVIRREIQPNFVESPVSEKLRIQDICVYAPGDVNKIGKEGRTSWDSFAYAIMMGHNVWSHANAVQKANEAHDRGEYSSMLHEEKFDSLYIHAIIDEIFQQTDKDRALALIEDYNYFWLQIQGSRGASGKKTLNGEAAFDDLFKTS